MNYETFVLPPSDFIPHLEAAGCYCQVLDKILLLKRHPERPQGGTWGVPAGKIEGGEEARAAVLREVYEEIGLRINDAALLEMGKLYIRLPHMNYVFHLFCTRFLTVPRIDLNLAEHLEARWVTIKEAQELPLIAGGREALQFYERWIHATRKVKKELDYHD